MVVLKLCSKDELSTKLKEAGNKLVIVDFSATWCNPCKRIAPIFEVFSNNYTDAFFYKVDEGEAAELCEAYAISAFPTFIFFKDGKQVTTIVGGNDGAIEEKIKELTVMQQQ
ncbi:uncharacterized protein LOC144592346 [Rhinoraja longicauda]